MSKISNLQVGVGRIALWIVFLLLTWRPWVLILAPESYEVAEFINTKLLLQWTMQSLIVDQTYPSGKLVQQKKSNEVISKWRDQKINF